ncbi:NAD(P)-binding protein [Lophiostoma macrostomum CBS 122681]|uniref:NAD(P)-binding protein n=1 Tax=Lophiostoma macrostomum CBS 122681 TaxID=1314788 RepID=A0A6A6TRH7_9PLEO|nr:NAD(P)-binding protein [Lophiostoma macrostomum CBS 122681]
MRALIRTGTPKTLTLDLSHPEPTPSGSPDYYLIRTHATALTREELTWPEPLQADIPIPGYDVAGVVISTPTAPHPENGTYKFKPGDEVYAMTTFVNQGNARETSEAHETELALKPKNMSWEEAASVPLSALSAWQALFTHGRLSPTFSETRHGTATRVLVTAASGSVGIWGIQLAHLASAEVIGICGPANVQFVKDLGADTVLDYTKTNLVEWVEENRETREFDVVLDCIGGQTLEDAWKCTKREGKVISVAVPPESKKPAKGVAEEVTGVWFIVTESGDQLGQIARLIEQEKCKGIVDCVYEMEQFQEAFERLEGGHAKGKVILKVQ